MDESLQTKIKDAAIEVNSWEGRTPDLYKAAAIVILAETIERVVMELVKKS